MASTTFLLHDESVNTYGFRMLTSGANLAEFRKNPVMFLNHEDHELPIGRWENIRVEGDRILADAVFDEGDPRASEVMRKVDEGFLRAASIGTWAPEALSDDPALKLPGQTGPTATKWTLREASVVTIGANHNALAMYDRMTGDRLDLSDAGAVVRLMDQSPKSDKTMFEKLKNILRMRDAVPEAEVVAAVEGLQAEKERLAAENQALKDAASAAETERRRREAAEAAALVDAAVRDGRIHNDGREACIALFAHDFDSAKAALDAIPPRQSFAARIEKNDTALQDFAGSWDELDRAGKLMELRDKNPDLFREKFREKFGVEYKG